MTTEARKASWRAYYERNKDKRKADRKARYDADPQRHQQRALGHYYAHRQDQNQKRTARFVQDRHRARGAWSREVEALAPDNP